MSCKPMTQDQIKMNLWKETFVAAIAAGNSTEFARISSNIAVSSFEEVFPAPKGLGVSVKGG